MRVLVTGAGGHIGRAVVAELSSGGHDVTGFVRSAGSAAAVEAAGAAVHLGDVNDLDQLVAASRQTDAIVHLAYDNRAVRTGRLSDAAEADLRIVQALGDALDGTGTALIGVGVNSVGDAAMDRVVQGNPRFRVSTGLHDLADRGIRAVVVGIPLVTHSRADRTGFVPTLLQIATQRQQSGFVGDGANRWPAVHTMDLATLFRLAVERAPAGSQLLAAAEPGVEFRQIAEAIGEVADVPVVSLPPADAVAHFAPFPFASVDLVMPSDATRELLDWQPRQPTLLEDLRAGVYRTGTR